MEISWLGHACFRLRSRDLAVVTDPYRDAAWGYRPLAVSADVVTISHEHPHHAAADAVEGSPRVLRRPGEYEIGGSLIWGVRTPRTDGAEGGAGVNVVFAFRMEDVLVCHLGDLVKPLTTDQLAVVQDCDVLLVPVGGHCTLGAVEAAEVVAQITPRLIVPMHYGTPQTAGHVELETAERFCREMGVTGTTPQARLNVTAGTLPAEPTVALLEPPRAP